MEKYNELKRLILSLEADVTKIYKKKNHSAAVRVRKKLQEVKAKTQGLREDISSNMKVVAEERRIKLELKKAEKAERDDEL